MSNDKLQDKYDEIFQELKDEKMDLDFQDFLKKTEVSDMHSIHQKKEMKRNGFKNYFWIAASIVLLIGLFFLFKDFRQDKIKEQEQMVKNELLRQKKSGELIDKLGVNPSTLAVNDTASVQVKDTVETSETSVTDDEESLNKILPKRGRLKRSSKTFLVHNADKSPKKDSKNIEYSPDYVIINGQKIESEQEAIDVTKYSFQILGDKVARTVETTSEKLNIEY